MQYESNPTRIVRQCGYTLETVQTTIRTQHEYNANASATTTAIRIQHEELYENNRNTIHMQEYYNTKTKRIQHQHGYITNTIRARHK